MRVPPDDPPAPPKDGSDLPLFAPIPDLGSPPFRHPPYRPDAVGAETSKAAADLIAPRAEADRIAVYRCHLQHPEGLTDFELADLLHGLQTSFGARRVEMMHAGLFEDTKQRRPAREGGRTTAIVWRLIPPPPDVAAAMRLVEQWKAAEAAKRKDRVA